MRLIPVLAFTLMSFNAFANHDGSNNPDCNHMQPNFSLNYLDENQDGKVTKQEYLQGDNTHTAKTFEHMDANGDGVLDKAELAEIEQVYQLIHQAKKTTTPTKL